MTRDADVVPTAKVYSVTYVHYVHLRITCLSLLALLILRLVGLSIQYPTSLPGGTGKRRLTCKHKLKSVLK